MHERLIGLGGREKNPLAAIYGVKLKSSHHSKWISVHVVKLQLMIDLEKRFSLFSVAISTRRSGRGTLRTRNYLLFRIACNENLNNEQLGGQLCLTGFFFDCFSSWLNLCAVCVALISPKTSSKLQNSGLNELIKFHGGKAKLQLSFSFHVMTNVESFPYDP